MKVAIYPDYGVTCLPEALAEGLSTDFLEERLELARRIEALPFTHDEPLDETEYMTFKHTPLTSAPVIYVRVKSMPDKIIVKFPSVFNQEECTLEVIDVDTSIPWTVSDVHGYERVHYFKQPTILDPITNYSTW